MAKTSEHRYTDRHPMHQEVMLSTADKFQLCKIHDISITGALLSVAWFGLSKGTEVTLTMNIAAEGEKKDSRTLPAKVVRVSRDGTAISFNETLEASDRNALLRFLKSLK